MPTWTKTKRPKRRMLPDYVEDAIADIATVFHWQPSAYDEMTVFELADWREKARVRAETAEE